MIDRFYPICDCADFVERIVPTGVRCVQLRMKNGSDADYQRQALRARQYCQKYGAQLILNDYWALALELGIDFVHLGQEDMDQADFAALRRAGIRYGLSTHDEAELERALSYKPAYVALGPIYPTKLKKMKWAPQGLARLGQWKKAAGDTPLVAIGGLIPERAPGVFEAGADSIAVVTDLKLAENPEERCKVWLRATRKTG